MDDIPLSWELATLLALLVLSAFFSIAETAMMAINRYRLRHLTSEADRAAIRVTEMLKRTDRLLGGSGLAPVSLSAPHSDETE